MSESALLADISEGLEKIIFSCAGAANAIAAANITSHLDGKKYICSIHVRTMDNLRQKRIQKKFGDG